DDVSNFFNKIERTFPGITDLLYKDVCMNIHDAVDIDTHDAFHEVRTTIARCMIETSNSEVGSAVGSVGTTAIIVAVQMYILGRCSEILKMVPDGIDFRVADIMSLTHTSTYMREQV